ncbi:NAD-dependent epimerase/dehydratase family protein [Halomicrococcus sp. NG-SE-24]|uniref:NAD-dependent epimerase/dehydratase family protein n=1 Tax=Halomicrococcus sp. NG-SE-24 TaxID=3436928 RepID=UPI003D98CAC8
MEYFVTGATGLIGTHVVELLVDRGHDVVGLTRSRSNAKHLPEEVTIVEGDITHKESMRESMAGVDGVFHIAAWLYFGPGPWEAEKAERINVGGTRNVLELMDDLDIPKGVYTSTIGVYPGTSGEKLDESIDPDCPTYAEYVRTKWQAHFEVARPMIEDGLPLVIVQPGIVYGPHGETSTDMIRDYLTSDLPIIPRNWAMPFDHAEDIAHAHLNAMESGTLGEEYIVASQARTLPEVFAYAEEITGTPAPRPVPDVVFSTLATIMRNVERVTIPPEGFESEGLDFLSGRQWSVDNTKSKRELDIEFRPLEEGLRDYLPWELNQLGMDKRPEQSAPS